MLEACYGDFLRPIPDKDDLTPFIGAPPRQEAHQYHGRMPVRTIEKLNQPGSAYRPPNLLD